MAVASAANSSTDSEKLTPPDICCTMPLDAEMAYDISVRLAPSTSGPSVTAVQ